MELTTNLQVDLNTLVQAIIDSNQPLFAPLQQRGSQLSLGLRRSARLPVLSALYSAIQQPILYLTDRADHALTSSEEINLWLPEAPRLFFPEPTPLFYEKAAWGDSTRRERLTALTALAAYHIPGAPVLPQSSDLDRAGAGADDPHAATPGLPQSRSHAAVGAVAPPGRAGARLRGFGI